MNNLDWARRDRDVLWHPCTQMKDHERVPMIPIRSGSGVWLEDFDGNRYIDAISSWWVNLFGHANPTINQRLAEQASTLEHVILAGLTHPAATELAERLVGVTPPGLDRVFFADSGSAAVEIALKMSFHYWRNVGRPERRRFVCLSGSYHGETLGALAVSNVGLYKAAYEPLLLEPIVVRSPDAHLSEPGSSPAEHAERCFEDMERTLADRHDEICAVIVEPLVQCAGGMRMYDPIYLERLRRACDRYDIHLIADEIAVGFGRTGTLFACEQAGISPDLMCLSKGLTGGYLPLSAVLARERIYQAFYADFDTRRAFLHSHSYTGNALCCAAALAVLDLFAASDVIGDNRRRAERMRRAVEPLHDHPNVGEIRQTGMILAIEMVGEDGLPPPANERRGLHVFRHGLANRALIRPLDNVVYLMPPYVIADDEIDHLGRVVADGIDRAARADGPAW